MVHEFQKVLLQSVNLWTRVAPEAFINAYARIKVLSASHEPTLSPRQEL